MLTGKGLEYGGSLLRPEATGYGAVYFLSNMLAHKGDNIEGKSVMISGSGNVALHAAEKIIQLGGKVLILSDNGGFIHDPDGFDATKLVWLKKLKLEQRGRSSDYADKYDGATFHSDAKPWSVKYDVAIPCAIQNELDKNDAKILVGNGVIVIVEGANMPTSNEGVDAFLNAKVLFGPGKAANAGGVAVSGLEISQNSSKVSWDAEKLDGLLLDIMQSIHHKCVSHGATKDDDYINYVKGANIAAFEKVAGAMLAYGVV